MIDKIIELAKEKLSKKQIIAVVGILAILSIVLTTNESIIFPTVKAVCIMIVVLVSNYFQWDIDKEKNNENKTDNVDDVPAVS